MHIIYHTYLYIHLYGCRPTDPLPVPTFTYISVYIYIYIYMVVYIHIIHIIYHICLYITNELMFFRIVSRCTVDKVRTL